VGDPSISKRRFRFGKAIDSDKAGINLVIITGLIGGDTKQKKSAGKLSML